MRPTREKTRVLFGALLFTAAVLRLTGVSWDDRRHLHPDERFLSMVEESIQAPSGLAGYFDSAHSPLNPFNKGFNGFVYGTLPVFLAKAIASPLHRDGYDSTFLIGRVLSALFDLLTIWLTYRLARRFAGRSTALTASALLAFCPLGLQLSHFWGVDSFLTTFSALALIGCVRIARGRTGPVSLAATGAAIGLAVACKITGLALLGPAGVAVLASAFPHWSRAAGREERPPFAPAVLRLVVRGVVVLAATFISARIALPYAFSGVFRPDPRYISALRELTNLTKGYGFPPQVQWAGRTPLFAFRNLLFWGAGIFFGIPAIAALLWAPWTAWRRRNPEIFLLWLHAAVVFGYHSTAATKNIRYFYPAYPALAVLASLLLASVAKSGQTEQTEQTGRTAVSPAGTRWFARWLPTAAVVGTLLFGVAFCSIYRRPNSRVAASHWMYRNIRPPAAIGNEDWDDGLPFPEPNYEIKDYAGPVFHMYNPDSPKKVEELVEALRASDWIAITSNRAYASVTRIPDVFPMTREYYRTLFEGRLGFQRAADFTSYPSLGPLRIPDDSAEETFTVYDHPRVLLFRKTANFDSARVRKILLAALPGPLPSIDEWAHWPRAKRHVVDPILPGPAAIGAPGRSVAAGAAASVAAPAAGTTARPLADELLGSWPAAILFFLALLAVGACAFPLCFALFDRLDDRGHGIARIAGLAAVTYLLTVAVQSHVIANGRGAAIAAVLVLAAAGAAAFGMRRHEIVAFVRTRRRELLVSEGVFLFGFIVFAGLRALNPEIHWGEKPMDFSILNILVRTHWLPASDPWFAGAPLGYYTFGQEMVALLSFLTGLSTRYTFNLAFGLLGGATLQAAHSLVRNWTRSVRAGLAGAAFVGILGNLAGLREWLINQPAHHEARHLDWHYFWATSRVIRDTINEYPFWSMTFADLHAHVFAIPIFLLVVTCALSLVRRSIDPVSRPLGRSVAAAVFGAAAAVQALTNAWDVPLLAGLLVLVACAMAFAPGRPSRGSLARALAALAISAAVGVLLVLPLWVRGGGAPGHGRNTEPGAAGVDILTHFGLFVFLVLAWWLVSAARRMGARTRRPLLCGVLAVCAGAILAVLGFRSPDVFCAVSIAMFLFAAAAFESEPEDRLACGFVASAFFLILFTQRFYIYDRMNTFFKLYLEAWLLFAVSSAVLVFRPSDRRGALRTWPVALRAVFGLLVAAALFTTVTGGRGVVSWNRTNLPDGVAPGKPSLDGLAYLERWHPGEYRAVLFLRQSVAGTPVVLEAQGPSYQEFSRISMFTGLPTVLGWEYHVQQRGNAPAEIDARRDAVKDIYASKSGASIESLLRRYHVGYVYVGALERKTYPAAGLAKFAAESNLFQVAYENPEATIYRVVGGDSEDVVLPRREKLPEITPEGAAAAPASEPDVAPEIQKTPSADLAAWAHLREPRGAAVDARGRVWIADFGHSRLRVFDAQGGTLGGWGGRGDGPHGFNELCGVAIRGDQLAVADTWNGRIESFDLDGNRKAAVSELYGPRGVAIGPDGRVWAADTGNGRVMRYSANLTEGVAIGRKGSGPGEFSSPIGIDAGPSGNIYVADTGNRRIQILDPDGAFRQSWPIVGWGEGAEPQLAVDTDGTVYVTDPIGNALLELSPEGRPLRRMLADGAGKAFSRPTGLALNRKTRMLYVINSGDSSVTTIALPERKQR